MSKRFKVVPSGRFKGKRITFASTEQVESFDKLVGDFMSEIFDLQPGDYLISDESDVLDFAPMDEADASGVWCRIEEIYGIQFTDVGSGRLVRIFAAIAHRKQLQ